MRKCLRAIVLLAFAALTLTSAWAGNSDEAAKKELKLFQGSWKAVAIRNADGNEAPQSDVQQTRLTVEGNAFTLTSRDVTIKGTFSVNPAKTPKAIDVVLKGDNGEETKLLGIYQVKGDIRKSCFAMPQQDRPSQFMTEKGYVRFEGKRN